MRWKKSTNWLYPGGKAFYYPLLDLVSLKLIGLIVIWVLPLYTIFCGLISTSPNNMGIKTFPSGVSLSAWLRYTDLSTNPSLYQIFCNPVFGLVFNKIKYRWLANPYNARLCRSQILPWLSWIKSKKSWLKIFYHYCWYFKTFSVPVI